MYNWFGDTMFDDMYNIKLIDIAQAVSVTRGEYKNRFSHAFVYKLTGESLYDFGRRTIPLRAGEVLFIPKGASYTVRRTSREESRYLLINFDAETNGAVSKVFPLAGFSEEGVMRGELARLWLTGGPVEHYRCTAVFYNLLSFLTGLARVQYAETTKLEQIRAAVDYLNRHLFDCDLRTGELHRRCGMSGTYFRHIFKANFGVTPQEYVTNKRLVRASCMIAGGECRSIQQVARTVGYDDPLYFSRLFSERYGVSPSKYRKRLSDG